MTNPVTDARATIVAALRDAGLTAYGYTPPTVLPPAVYVEPGNPWLEHRAVGKGFAATLHLTAACVVNLVDVAESTPILDDLIVDVIAALPPGVDWQTVDTPEVDSTGSQGSYLRASIALLAHVKE